MKDIIIQGKKVNYGLTPFIIAEGGVNHNSDLDLAIKLIDAAAEAGADAIKFQIVSEKIGGEIKKLYPELGEYAEVVSLAEVLRNSIPSKQELEKRFEHYITIDGKVSTEPDIERAKEDAGIELQTQKSTKGILLKEALHTKGYTWEKFLSCLPRKMLTSLRAEMS